MTDREMLQFAYGALLAVKGVNFEVLKTLREYLQSSELTAECGEGKNE
jgi:hypothetical protein